MRYSLTLPKWKRQSIRNINKRIRHLECWKRRIVIERIKNRQPDLFTRALIFRLRDRRWKLEAKIRMIATLPDDGLFGVE